MEDSKKIAERMLRNRSLPNQEETRAVSDYERNVMGYLVHRLQVIYGPKFDGVYKTDDMVIQAQREFVHDLGDIIPDQYGDRDDQKRSAFARQAIDSAMNVVKRNMGRGEHFEWPNIGAIVRLVRDCAQPHSFYNRQRRLPEPPPVSKEKGLEYIEAIEKQLTGISNGKDSN